MHLVGVCLHDARCRPTLDEGHGARCVVDGPNADLQEPLPVDANNLALKGRRGAARAVTVDELGRELQGGDRLLVALAVAGQGHGADELLGDYPAASHGRVGLWVRGYIRYAANLNQVPESGLDGRREREFHRASWSKVRSGYDNRIIIRWKIRSLENEDANIDR